MKALAVGAAVESALVAGLFLGGINEFGPASSWGWVVLVLHTPALLFFELLGANWPLRRILAVAACAAAWSALAFLVLRARSRLNSDR